VYPLSGLEEGGPILKISLSKCIKTPVRRLSKFSGYPRFPIVNPSLGHHQASVTGTYLQSGVSPVTYDIWTSSQEKAILVLSFPAPLSESTNGITHPSGVKKGRIQPEGFDSQASRGLLYRFGGSLFGEVIPWPKKEPNGN
jgi:hypothetical protein